MMKSHCGSCHGKKSCMLPSCTSIGLPPPFSFPPTAKKSSKKRKGQGGDGLFDWIPGGVGDALNDLGNAGFNIAKQAAPALIQGYALKGRGMAGRKRQKGKGALGSMLGSLFPF